MSPTASEFAHSRTTRAIVGVVCASVLTAIGITSWSFFTTMAGKPIGTISNEESNYIGPVKDGELWYIVTTREPRFFAQRPGKTISTRIKKMNLATGIESETGIRLNWEDVSSFNWFCQAGDQVYVTSADSIFQIVENILVRVGPMISNPADVYNESLFDYQGQLTAMRFKEDGSYCLAHLIDETWVDGRPIVLPGPHRIWRDDPQQQRQVLIPLTSEQPPITPPPRRARTWIDVASWNGQFYLLFADMSQYMAYRIGFEFADEPEETASALAPVNAPREATAWQAINHGEQNIIWGLITPDEEGQFVAVIARAPSRLFRRYHDGRWHKYDIGGAGTHLSVEVDHQTRTPYVFWRNYSTWSEAICRIQGDEIQSPHIIKSRVGEYLARWKQLCVGLILAWCFHVAVLALGFRWMTRSEQSRHYAFAHQRVALASFGRRGIAFVFDLALVFAALFAAMKSVLPNNLAVWRLTEEQIAEWLIELECLLNDRGTRILYASWNDAFRPIVPNAQLLLVTEPLLPYGASLLAFASMLGLVGLLLQARYGITPGKWLFGIRTVRSTLRPCGFARSLVRTVLCFVDASCGLTPIPAVIAMLYSDRWQRLGDRVADTVVVRTSDLDATTDRRLEI